jgi:hypothetical protein
MDANERPIEKITIHPMTRIALILCGSGIVLTGVISWIYDAIKALVN